MKEKLRKYYFYGLAPAIVMAILIGAGTDLIFACYFMVGFSWPYSFYTPNLRAKINENPSRLSFISLSFQCHDFLFEKLGTKVPHIIVRGVIPCAFALINYMIAFDYRCSMSLVGFFAFEIFYYIDKKRNLNLIEV